MVAVRKLTAGFVESAAAVAVVGTTVDLGVTAGDASLVDGAEDAVGGHGRTRRKEMTDHHVPGRCLKKSVRE